MKHHILTRPIAALLLALSFAHAEDQKAEEKKDAQKSEKKSSSSSVVTSTGGEATITIDINGKKETRTFKLGDGNKAFNFGKEGDGAKAGGGGGGGGKGFAKPEQGKHEKGPWLGVAMEPVQDVVRAQLSLAPGEGVVINHVAPDGPAAKAGLEPNDILLRFEDQIIVEPSQLKKLIAMKKPGESVKLTYLRKGERHDTVAKLIEHELEPIERNGNSGPWLQTPSGFFVAPGGGMDNRLEHLQEQLKQLKDKHPGIIVDKRSWLSGEPGDTLKGQIEKMLGVLENSNVPKEEIERLRKQLDHAKRETQEAMERAKQDTEKAMKEAQRAMEEAKKSLNGANKPHEKPNDETPKKPGGSL